MTKTEELLALADLLMEDAPLPPELCDCNTCKAATAAEPDSHDKSDSAPRKSLEDWDSTLKELRNELFERDLHRKTRGMK